MCIKLHYIIFDASTLILTAKVEILRKIASKIDIKIPPEIKEESTRKDTPDAKLIEKLIDEGMIKVKKIGETGEIQELKKEFSIGDEAYAIRLAEEEDKPLATDDKQAIKLCKILGLEFITAIDFLIRMSERGDISKAVSLEKLKSLKKYGRYSQEITDFAKMQIGGKENENH